MEEKFVAYPSYDICMKAIETHYQTGKDTGSILIYLS